MLSQSQIDRFQDRGFLRLPKYVAPGRCAEMLDKTWIRLAKLGFEKETPETWKCAYQAGFRLKTIRRGLKFPELYTDELRVAARQLLDGSIAREDTQNLLLTFPDTVTGADWDQEGFFPQAWHTDCPRVPQLRSPGIIMLTYIDDVDPAGGGTCILAGSHRLMLSSSKVVRSKHLKRHLRRHEFFNTLLSKDHSPSFDARGLGGIVDDISIEVVELTGQAGDVILVDGRMLHAISSNKTSNPRFMVRGFFFSHGLMTHYRMSTDEVAQAA